MQVKRDGGLIGINRTFAAYSRILLRHQQLSGDG
jgi:hypothetical protein